ncbi:MAG: hypothetical protein PWP15_388 [Methanothermococcus sp.]|uniref:hypothetical protein n=1 Tax=Methanothermococcus TaxID=155862 RepID=UPI000365F482|nr:MULTISPECIES: hypothetical protein [Methanothermococcus]MDK2789881.1 hypothetical protein [Methanothermococcus sp.]MDK2987358.1 hypothetical protein [Methanothermococcus sp.]
MHMVKKSNTSMKEIIKHAKTTPSATLSLIVWSLITIWATIYSKNIWVFICSLPFIVGLTIIPLKISEMNSELSQKLSALYGASLTINKIEDVTKDMLNSQVKIAGIIEKITYGISPKPTIKIKDETGEIYSMLFTPLPDGVKKGDKIELYGVVTKHYKFFGFMGIPRLWKPKIYGIGVKKLD